MMELGLATLTQYGSVAGTLRNILQQRTVLCIKSGRYEKEGDWPLAIRTRPWHEACLRHSITTRSLQCRWALIPQSLHSTTDNNTACITGVWTVNTQHSEWPEPEHCHCQQSIVIEING